MTKDSTNTGGPAFPYRRSVNDSQLSTGGMTLRDYFAGQAAVALIRNEMWTAGTVAESAYRVADAMLAERGK